MGKRIRIRLYRVQDYDLVTLYYDKKFGLKRKIEEALICFANGRPLPSYSLKGVEWLPKPEMMTNGEKSKTGTKFVIVTSISLPDNETAAIELLDGLASGDLVNNFLKSLIRRCFMDLEYLYIDADKRGAYKDPGNAVSSKRVADYEAASLKREPAPKPTPSPKKDAPAANKAKDEPVRTQAPVTQRVEAQNPAVENNKSFKETPPKREEKRPASAADLFSMADSYSY